MARDASAPLPVGNPVKHMPTPLIVFFSIFLAIGLLVLAIGLHGLWMSYQAKNWPTTNGTVLSCEVKSEQDDKTTTYEAVVNYRYVVAGRTYSGNNIAFTYSASSLRESHQEIADRLTGVASVLVRYDPRNVARSVLTYGLNRSTTILLVFGTTWVVFVAGLALLCSTVTQSDYGILRTLVTTR